MIIDEEGRVLPGLFKDDFEMWLQDNGFVGENHSHGVTNNESNCRIWHLPERAHPTNWTARETCRWINRLEPDTPFFAWMSFSAPHPPYTPPFAYWELFRDIPIPEPITADWASLDKVPAPFVVCQLPGNFDWMKGEWYRKTVRAYHALVTQIDFQISVVIGMLRENRLLENTIILYLADHGDMLGDFGTFAKRVFYEGSASVPFILVLPEGHPDYHCGEISYNPVGLQDVMPTLLDAAGLEAPGTITGMSALAGLKDPSMARTLVHGDYTKGADTTDASHMITDGHMKYIWYNEGNREQLFDLERDPKEQRNLASENEMAKKETASLVAEWRQRLIDVLTDERSPDVKDGRLVDIPYPEIDERRLRSLNIFNNRGMHY
jgi:arylsulfatase A-like enzyme